METLPPEIGLALVRVTEATALVAARWMGSGDRESAHQAATETMFEVLNDLNIKGCIVIGEEGRVGAHSSLDTGQPVGTGNGPDVDVVVDPIDGTGSVVKGRTGAISVVGLAPRGSIWSPHPAVYMNKIIVDRDAAEVLVPECMGAPAAWTLALVARAKGKAVRDLQVIVLDRPRHVDLINEIREAGARVLLRDDGDTVGALIAATPQRGADILMGIGGMSEGVTAACAVKGMGGGMLGQLAPQSDAERVAIAEAELDIGKVMTSDELVSTDQVVFAATGVTDGLLLAGVEYGSRIQRTSSLLIRGGRGTRRLLQTEHPV